MKDSTAYTSTVDSGKIGVEHYDLYIGNEIYFGGDNNMEPIENSTENTFISGTDDADIITNDGENVTIEAGDGDVSITKSAESVVIDAGAGNDTITNEGANVVIISGEGDNYIENNGENVTVNAGDGNDSITNYAATVLIFAGAGNDTITNNGANVEIISGEGDNYIENEGENVTINAGDGDDSIINNSAADVSIFAGAGNNTITNNGANVEIISGEGDDYIENEGENVTINVGDGNNTISGVFETTNIVANVTDATVEGNDVILTTYNGSITIQDAKDQTFLLNGEETVLGSEVEPVDEVISNDDSDTLISGTDDADTISNYGENVIIEAGDGDDSITNYAATVSIFAGAGNDTITNDGSNVEIISGEGDNYITNNGENVTIDGGEGNDTIITSGTNTTIDGGDGNDYIELTNNYKEDSDTVESAVIIASEGNDTIKGVNSDTNIIADFTESTISANNVILTTADGTLTILDGATSTFLVNGKAFINGREVMGVTTIGGVTYTPLNTDAYLSYDGDGAVIGIESGSIEVTLEGVEDSPKITLDGTKAFDFTANVGNNGLAISYGSESNVIDYTSGNATYSADGISIDAGAVADGSNDSAITLATSGKYTLNSNEITTTESNVSVTISGNDEVRFDATAAVTVEDHKYTSDVEGNIISVVSNESQILLNKSSNVTIDGKTFTLTENSSLGIAVEVTEYGFVAEQFVNNVAKNVTINDKDYKVTLNSKGIQEISGVSDNSQISINTTIDGNDNEDANVVNIRTDSTGKFTFGGVDYTVSGDNEVLLGTKFNNDGSAVVKEISELNGTISGDFSTATTVNASSFEVVEGYTYGITIVADSDNITLGGITDGGTVKSSRGVSVEMTDVNLNVNNVEYQLLDDEEIIIKDNVITGLDVDAQLIISEAGKYTVNGTALTAKESNSTVIAVTENYTYIVDKSNPQFNSNTTASDILDSYGVDSDKVAYSSDFPEGNIPATVAGATAVVESSTESDTKVQVQLGNRGNLAVVEDTKAPVTIKGGRGDDTVVTGGENVKFDMANGGADKVIATGGKVTLENYSPSKTDGGIKLTTDDIKNGVKFGEGGVQLSNAEVSVPGNLVNIYTPDDQKQAVGFVTSANNKLDFSDSKEDLIIVGGGDSLVNEVGNSTLTGGKGNDTIQAGKGDYIDAGKGSNKVTMSDDGGSTLNFTEGRTTVDNFNFLSDGTDTATADSIQTGNVSVSAVNVDDNAVIIATENGTLKVEDALNKDMAFSNDWFDGIAQIGYDNLIIDDKANMYWAAGKDAVISVGDIADTDTTLSLKLDGSDTDKIFNGDIKSIDASNYGGAADLAGNDKGNVLTASKGGTTFNGGKGNDTIIGGDGADEFIYASGDGKDVVKNFNFGTDEDSDKINTGNAAVMNAETSGDDVVLSFNDNNDKVTIEGAAGKNMQFANDYASDGIVAQIVDNEVTIDGSADLFWAAGKNASITVNDLEDSDTTLSIKLDGSQDDTYRGDIKSIDASNYGGAADLAGNDKGNVLTASKGGSTLAGGKGKDTLIGGEGADEFVYAEGDGKDLVKNFNFGTDEDSDKINTGNAAVIGVDVKDNDIVLSFSDSKDKLTIEGGANENMQFANDYASDGIVARVGNDALNVDGTADMYWAAGKNATVTIGDIEDTDKTLAIKLDDLEQETIYRGDIKVVDASNYNGTADLAGNYKNNIITASKGGSTLTGGEGKDTLIGGDGADEFVYASGDGRDIVKNFNFGTDENSDKLNTGEAAVMNANVKGNNIVLSFEENSDELTIENAAGQDMQFANTYATVVAQVADKELTYDGTADMYWATGKNATLKVSNEIDNDEEVSIWLDNSENGGGTQYRGDIKYIDASDFGGKAELVGNEKNNVIIANNYGNTLWGGADSSNDTLIGGNGDDVFYYGLGNGKDIIQGAGDNDTVILNDITLDMITNITATENSIKLEFTDGGSLELDTNNGTTFTVDGQNYTYNKSENTWVQK